MSITPWTPPFADGWWPRISPDGKYLLCGNAIGRVVEIATKKVVQVGTAGTRYISQGWFNEKQALVANDNGLYRIDAPAFAAPVRLAQSGNFIGVGGEVWAFGNTKKIWRGDAYGHPVNIAAGYAATVGDEGVVCYSVSDGHLVVWKSGQVQREIKTAHATNRFLCGARGYVGYGYSGPSWLNTPTGQEMEVGVTPNRVESPPLAFLHLNSVWLATTDDYGTYLRPLGVRDRAIVIPGGAVECSVVSLGTKFLVATCTDKGRLTLNDVPADTRMEPVSDHSVPPKPEPAPTPKPPKATIETFESPIVVGGTSRSTMKITQGMPYKVRWLWRANVLTQKWETAAENFPNDTDHTFNRDNPPWQNVFPAGEGKFPIRIQCIDKDGKVLDESSATSRVIEVRATVTPPVEPPIPPIEPPVEPPATGVARKGVPRANHFSVVDDTGPWLPWGTSLFWGAGGWLRERDRTKQNVDWAAGKKIDYLRVMATGLKIGANERSVSPKDPAFQSTIAELTDYNYSKAPRTMWTIFGATYDAPSVSDRQRAVDLLCEALKGKEHKVQMIEIANEGWQNGFSGDSGAKELKDLAARVRSHLPNVLIATTCPQATDDITPDMIKKYYQNCPAATCQTLHFSRSTKAPDGLWRPTRKPWRESHFSVDGCCQLCSNNEPRGPESSGTETNDPLLLAMDAVVSWQCGVGMYLLHTGAGIHGTGDPRGSGPEDDRPANLWETVNIDAICNGILTVRALLPPDLPNFSKFQSNASNAPFRFHDTPEEQFTCAYSAEANGLIIHPVGGVIQNTTFTLQSGSCDGKLYHPVSGQVLETFTKDFHVTTEHPGVVAIARRK
jgi:hypothetical protein